MIALATLNARWSHAAFGLRYLRANLAELRDSAVLVEQDLDAEPHDFAAAILEKNPRLVGISVYIWNVTKLTTVVAILKRLRPELPVVIGGPEVSHECDDQDIVRLADYTIAGEGDLAFRDLCRRIFAGETPPRGVIHAAPPPLAGLALPYDEYTDLDLARRVIYVEASRGCPYTCEFCLSALDDGVRTFEIEAFLRAMQRLLDRGARQFKFVDRTFNLGMKTATRILDFFLARLTPELHLHFELIPDRLPSELKERIRRFPPGVLQFEVGIQSFDDSVNAAVKRRQDGGKAEENLRWLRQETTVHLHTDLIAGLPGDSLCSFGESFDRLHALGPHEIQVGILKRLRGAPLVRHESSAGLVFSPAPPYEILRSNTFSFEELEEVRHLARVFDRVANHGQFPRTLPLLTKNADSAFGAWLGLTRRIRDRHQRTHALSLADWAEAVFDFLVAERGFPESEVGAALAADYAAGGRTDQPPKLKPWFAPRVDSPRSIRRGRERQDRQRTPPSAHE